MNSSGSPWMVEEDERLRVLWLSLVGKFPGRSEAAARARLNLLAERNYHNDWPNKPPAPTMHQIIFAPEKAADIVAAEFGDAEISMTKAANAITLATGLPHYYAVKTVERLVELGLAAVRVKGRLHRFVRLTDEA